MPASNRGGKRSGSGRNPGPLTTGSALHESPSARTYLQVDDAQPLAAVAFFARGLSYAEIGRRLSRDEHTIAKWVSDRPDLLESEVRRLVDPAESLRQHLPRATQAYGEALNSERDAVKLAAAEGVYDRVYGKPVVRTELKAQVEALIVFVDAPD
jgi:hypothetical protein